MKVNLDIEYLTGKLTGETRPKAIGTKFDCAGQVLNNPGNTMICHIDRESDVYRSLVSAQDRLKSAPLAQAFTFLPSQSLHMTVFPGIIDHSRTQNRWPQHLPLNATIDNITEDFSQNLNQLKLPQKFTIKPINISAGFCVSVQGADNAAETDLRMARDILKKHTHIQDPEHDNYKFHITFAYLLHWLSADEAQRVVDYSNEIFDTCLSSIDQIELGPVEFCTFDTMHHFQTKTLI